MPSEQLRLPTTPFSRQVALVCGFGAIGKAVAQRFHQDGYRVCVLSRDSHSEFSQHKDYLCLQVDLRDKAKFAAALGECSRRVGAPTVAVCCAGDFPLSKGFTTISSPDPQPIATIELNYARLVGTQMRQNEEGSMVFITSSISQKCIDAPGMTEFVCWATSLQGLADGMVHELRQCGVRVSILELGFVSGSKFSRNTAETYGFKSINPKLTEDKWVPPTDVGKTVRFLTEPSNLNATVWEAELNPQHMLEKNQIFTDAERVEEAVSKIDIPFQDRKVALVTGSGKGIGKGVALELCKAGYDIVALTRTAKDLDALEAECKALYPQREVLKIPVDVTDRTKIQEAVQSAVRHFGTLSYVVSNAGTNRRRVGAISDIETWASLLDVDLVAAMNIARLSLPYLIRHAKLQKKSGKPFLNFVSTRYAHARGVRMPGISAYIASKAATNAFAYTILEEVRDMGVGVSVFNPGTVATDLGQRPNQANKGKSTLIEPEFMIQPKDCGVCLAFAPQLSDNSVLSNVWLEAFYHTYPVVRKSQDTWLSKM